MNKQSLNLLKRILRSKKLSFTLVLAILAFIFSFSPQSFTQFLPNNLTPQKELNAKVLRVIDGDTVEVLSIKDSQKFKVRMYGIDAPEKTQAFGKEAKAYLSASILKQNIKLIVENKDKYGRIVGTIYLDNKDINEAMVKNGYAWAYESYSTKYLSEQADAQMFKLGLWKDEKPMKPSEFRRRSR